MEMAQLIALIVFGLGIAIYSSSKAVKAATSLAIGLHIPPFFIGMTLLAFGTDLPEMANSISASLAGHGDVNAGDSIGSTVTQITLVLGLLPFLVGNFSFGKGRIPYLGGLTVIGLLLGAWLMSDGQLYRLDGLTLFLFWLGASYVVYQKTPPGADPAMPTSSPRPVVDALTVLVFIAFTGGGSYLAVTSFIKVAEQFSVPEYLISFFALSIGTSLPELIVDITAIRKGQTDLAIGDVFGSSMVDCSLSLGIGPLVMPTAVTAAMALRGNFAAAGVVLFVTLLLSLRRKLDRRAGVALLLAYAAFFPLLTMD